MDRTIEQRPVGKIYLRILPFTGLLYFICYLDRVNVGFAALTMRQDLGLSQAALGLGMRERRLLHWLLHVRSTEQRDPATRSARGCGSRAS